MRSANANPLAVVGIRSKGILQNVAHFLLYRQAVPRGTYAQTGLKAIIKVTNLDAAHRDTPQIDINDFIVITRRSIGHSVACQ
jgi:hypothetical protein